MFKRCIWLVAVTIFLAFQTFAGGAIAAQLDEATRTVPLNEKGETVVLSLEQVSEGKRLFNYACAQCHVGGGTKTDPNINLSPNALSLASPDRNNIEGLVDYMHDPTSYDGLQSIAEVHPSTQSSDVYPKMRNLTEDDLYAIAGHILLQPKVAKGWAGGKAFY
jgi:photosystem II cytochrome c550